MTTLFSFENIQAPLGSTSTFAGPGVLSIQAIQLFGSLSLSKIYMGISGGNTTAKSITVSLGLYTLNGGTLTLVNSASRSSAVTSGVSWMTLITSASSAMVPGLYYLGVVTTSAGNSSYGLLAQAGQGTGFSGGGNAGPVVRGSFTTTTNGIPLSIATTDINKEGTIRGNTAQPYVVISS